AYGPACSDYHDRAQTSERAATNGNGHFGRNGNGDGQQRGGSGIAARIPGGAFLTGRSTTLANTSSARRVEAPLQRKQIAARRVEARCTANGLLHAVSPAVVTLTDCRMPC